MQVKLSKIMRAIAVGAGFCSVPAMAADTGLYGYVSIGTAQTDRKSEADSAMLNSGATGLSSTVDDEDTGYKLQFGYRLNRHLAVEGGRVKLGKYFYRASATANLPPPTALTRDVNIDIAGWNLGVVGCFPFSEQFAAFGKLGAVYTETDYHCSGTGVPCTNADRAAKNTTAYYGLGLDPWGAGHYTWNGNAVGISAQGETGGQEAVAAVMTQFLDSLDRVIAGAQQLNPGAAFGVIANRLPTIGYGTDGFRLSAIDPATGQAQYANLRFDTRGQPYNAAPGSPESHMSFGEIFLRSAVSSRGAIAPLWEVRTAAMQTAIGDPMAGLTEEERAGGLDKHAQAATGSTQTFRPVVLDLDGNGIETVGRDLSGVAFDVDDSGYLKSTAWVSGNDAFLTLDRNLNGSIDSGRELFSNGAVDTSLRGLAGLRWVDADCDGRIDAADPAWNGMEATNEPMYYCERIAA